MNKDLSKYGQYKNDIFNKLNFNFKRGLKILDVGCGDGSDSLILSEVFGLQTYSIDIYKNPAITKSNGVKFIIGTIFDIPFPDNYFDYIFLHDVLHHIDEENQSEIKHLSALNQVKRVTKENGKIIIIEGNRYNPIFFPHMVKMLDHNHWTQSYFLNIIHKAFKNVEIRNFESHLYPWGYKFWKIYELIMENIVSKKFLAYNVAIVKNTLDDSIDLKKAIQVRSFDKSLCCINCGYSLNKLIDRYKCDSCFSEFPITDGVGIFVNLDGLSKQLKSQVTYFENEDITSTIDYDLLPWQNNYIDRFIENFEDLENKTILDCGTGSGYVAIELALRGANVIALDLTLRNGIRLIKIAEKMNLSDKIQVICSSAENIPVQSGVVDAFVSNSVMEHLPNEKAAIDEVNRICKSKATLMIAAPIFYRFINPLLLPVNIIHDRLIGHLRRYDEVNLKNKFNSWDIKKTLYTGHTSKVFFVILNIILKKLKIKTINEQYIEDLDKRKNRSKWFSSNIIVFFERKK